MIELPSGGLKHKIGAEGFIGLDEPEHDRTWVQNFRLYFAPDGKTWSWFRVFSIKTPIRDDESLWLFASFQRDLKRLGHKAEIEHINCQVQDQIGYALAIRLPQELESKLRFA